LVHLAQEFAKLLGDIENILDGLENFAVVQKALLNDLLKVIIVHLADFFEVGAVFETGLEL
jgi:hypothetical protein